MPAPTHIIAICPVAGVALCNSTFGSPDIFSSGAPSLFAKSDTPVRVATHKVRSGGVSVAQMAIVDAFIITNGLTDTLPENPGDPIFQYSISLDGLVISKWVRDQPNPYGAILFSLGLTTDSGEEEE